MKFRATAVPVRMGVTRTTDYAGSAGAFYELPGLSVRSGFPDTVLASNKINLPAGNYKVSSRIIHGYQYTQFGVRLVLVSTGAVLATVTAEYTGVFDFVNTPFTHPGGEIRVEVYTEWSFSGNINIIAGSFVEIMPATWATLQGVLKTSAQSISGGAYALVNMGAIDPEHPGSAITTNGITIVGDGPVTVKCYARMIDSNSSGNKIQMYKNGSPIAGSEFIQNPAALTTQWGGTFTHTFANGDLLQMYGFTTGTVSNRREFSGDNTKNNTYFELMPA